MQFYTSILLVVYLLFLIGLIFYGKIQKKTDKDYLFLSGKVGFFFGSMGLMASLFSTFSLKGMPEFFHGHGVSGWLFLCLPITLQFSFILPVGLWFRNQVKKIETENGVSIFNMEQLFRAINLPKFLQFFFLIFVSLFLLPYITIQIKGAALLLDKVFPFENSSNRFLLWSVLISGLIILYSISGGLKSIYISDSVQGIILFVSIWSIAIIAIYKIGGIENLFQNIEDQKMLSLPGAKGIVTFQFLMVYVISILVAQIAQPQLFLRVLISKDKRTFVNISIAMLIIAPLVFIPAMIIGFYGLSVSSDTNFLFNLLQNNVPALLAGVYIVGLLAASMSTADSQIFAVGTEWAGIFKEKFKGKGQIILAKVFALVMISIACYLAQLGFKSIVLFAKNTFIGTGILSPIIFACLFFYKDKKKIYFITGLVAFFSIYFLLSIFKFAPSNFFGINSILWFYGVYVLTFIFLIFGKKKIKELN